MTNRRQDFASHWPDIVAAFLKLGATAFGGPPIMGIMLAGSLLGVLRSRLARAGVRGLGLWARV